MQQHDNTVVECIGNPAGGSVERDTLGSFYRAAERLADSFSDFTVRDTVNAAVLSGKGYNTAKDFLTVWANCGQAITNAVREVHKVHESTRELGTKLNLIEDEFDKSFDDLEPTDECPITTKDEVAPEV